MQKKTLYSILSVVVAMIILSITLVLAIGPKVSAYSDENRILVLDDWDDFEIYDTGYNSYDFGKYIEGPVCYGISRKLLEEEFGYRDVGCGRYGLVDENWNYEIDNRYDEIRIHIPEGVTYIVGGSYDFGMMPVGWFQKITELTFPSSLVGIEGGYGNRLFDLQDYDWNIKLDSLVLPVGLQYLPEDVFADLNGLEKIYYEGTSIPEGWEPGWNHVSDYYDDNSVRYEERFVEFVLDCNKTITFDTNGGSIIDSQIVRVDNFVAEPTAPTKEHYSFAGWYADAALTNKFVFNTPITDSRTLYAKWKSNQPDEPETLDEETSTAVNNQTNNGLVWGIAGTAAGILIIGGIVFGIVISKRRRK